MWITNTGRWRLKYRNTATEKQLWVEKKTSKASWSGPWFSVQGAEMQLLAFHPPALISPQRVPPRSPNTVSAGSLHDDVKRLWFDFFFVAGSISPCLNSLWSWKRGCLVWLLKKIGARHPPRSFVRPLNAAFVLKSELIFGKKNPLKSTGVFLLIYLFFW